MSKRLQKVVSVTTSITTILWLSGVAAFAPMAALAATINEGDTIRVANTLDIYIAKYVGAKKFKRLILSPSVFNSYGHLSWAAVKTVTQAEMDAFTTSDLVRALGDQKVYKLTPVADSDTGAKQWLNMTAEAFTAGGYDWDSIYVINNTDRDVYGAGTEITGGTSVSPSTSTAAGSLTVALASDTPAAGVAVYNAARVPFTKVNFTAGATAVTITSLTVQRTGLTDDAALASIVLVDAETNMLVGLSQTLNSAHQVVLSEALTIPANTTKGYILAANMANSTAYAGQIASLSLVGVATAATLSGTLPITGNGQTLNGTLAIGTATVAAGSLDPGTAATKNIGVTGVAFSSIKITAGSTEDITVSSIRWNQSGSAASSDLANLVVSDGTTNYATTVSADGKYYSASFGTAGLVIAKGLNKEFTVKGDILNGSARTVAFDLYRNTDVVVKGNVYGYYMTPTFTDNAAVHATANATDVNNTASPYFAGAHVTIGGGSLRVDKSATGAPTANITRGATGQILGAFDFVVQGEPVNVASIIVTFDHTGTGSSSDVTSVTLSKADGTVLSTGGTSADVANVAGTGHSALTLDGTSDGSVTFSGTVTFPVGTTQVIVKGNLNTDFVAADTFRVGFATFPSVLVSSITGGTTGNAITATPASAIWGNTMTIKGGSLTANISGTPVASVVIKGITGYTFSNIVFDASASGEDVRITQVILDNAYTAGKSTDVFGMQLFDGATALNTGANVVTPDSTGTPDLNTFTLDTPLVITKGTSKTIAVKGNVSASATATDTQTWGFTAATTNVTATGVSTGQTVTVTTTAQAGQLMTIASAGQYSVVLDSSTPTGKLIAANTTGNIMTVLKFKATSEQINVTKIRLSLNNASSTVTDLSNVYIYDGSTLLGSGVLGIGSAVGKTANASSTFTLSTPLVIPANGEKVVTIKADIASISTTETVAVSGHQIAIDYYGSAVTTDNIATGMSSGAEIVNYSVTTAQTAAFIYKSVPTVSTVALSTNTLANGTMDLYKFKVAADAKGDIDLIKFTFTIATSNPTTGGPITVKDISLVDVTESAEATLNATTTNTQFYADGGGVIEIFTYVPAATWGTATTTRTVSAGSSRTFALRATLAGTGSGASVTTYLMGDSAAPTSLNSGMITYTLAEADAEDDFIWSDVSSASHDTTPVGATISDWTNGYLVSGLPSSNLTAQTLSK